MTAGHPTSDQVEDNVAVESERRIAGTFLWLVVVERADRGRVCCTSRRSGAAPASEPAAAGRRIQRRPSRVARPRRRPRRVLRAAAAPARSRRSRCRPASAAAAAAPRRCGRHAAAGDQLTVALTAKRPCWVSATVDGQKSIERLLQPGEQQTSTVRREMVLTAGDASAIALTLNGADGRAARQDRRGRHRALQPGELQGLSADPVMGPDAAPGFLQARRGRARRPAAGGAGHARAARARAARDPGAAARGSRPRDPRDRRRDAEQIPGRGAGDVSGALRRAGRPARVLRRPRHLSRRDPADRGRRPTSR